MFKRNLFIPVVLIFFSIGLHKSSYSQVWNPAHAIGTQNGVNSYSYNQTPAQLVEIFPAAIPNSGLAYQWEQSTLPLSGFTSIPQGGTWSNYTFPGPLSQTMYFRRKTMDPNHGWAYIYSNTVKIAVVSQNWEDLNYVREHDVTTQGIITWQQVDQLSVGQKLQTTTYLDGLGRPIEKVSRETATPATSSGTWGDVVQFSIYDNFGRQQSSYLPYTTTNQSGKYKNASTVVSDQGSYYSTVYNETSPYSSLTFDNSPLNRVTNVKEPGTAWAAAAGKSVNYDVNSSSDDVKVFTVSYVEGSAPVLNGIYPDNQLYKLSYTDENGKQVVEFTDKSGHLILKKVQLDDTPSPSYGGWICTYFIYDDFGLLRYQLQPEAVNWLVNNSWNFSAANGTDVLAEWCFQYDYDEKGRIIWKKVPGAQPLNMIYDVRDRLAFAQDGNQAARLNAAQWTVTIYDDLDRPILSTLYNTTKTKATIKSDLDNALPSRNLSILPSINNNSGTTITLKTSYSSTINSGDFSSNSTASVLKYLFYDNYSFVNVKSFNNNFTNQSAYSTSDPNVQSISTTSRTLSMETGCKTRAFGPNFSAATFLNSTSYYDDRGSLIQTLEDNIRSGTDITTLQYHFDGRVLSSCSDHTNSGAGLVNYKILTKYNFDRLGRVTSIDKQFGGNSFKTVSSYDYDDIGRVKTKHLDPNYTANGGNELESLNYSFNIHNQLTGINKDYALKNPGNYNKWGHFFGMYLGFDNRDNTFAHAQLNGQVGGVLWNTQGDDAQRRYDYTYDNAGRLSNADFKEQQHTGDGFANNKMDFSVGGYSGKITYDLNGNILSMLQKGVQPGQSTPITVDDLRYTYNSFSNKLQSVTDQMTATSVNGAFGDFKDGTNGTDPDYVYDNNGNVITDLNKNVGNSGVHYNFLDKPDQITIAGKGTISITYSGDGEKLQRTFTPTTGSATTTTYINQFVYQSTGTGADVLSYINFEEGRLRAVTPTSQNNGYDQLTVDGNMDLPNSKRGAYDYFVLDHQQNVRMILSEETRVAGNTATMETSRAGAEDPVFGQTGGSNEVETTRYNTPSDWTGNSTASVSRLGNIAGHNIGPNTLQKVMAGDLVNANVQYYYNQPASNYNSNYVSNVLSSLLQAITNGPTSSVIKGNASNVTSQLNVNSGFVNAVQPSTNTGVTPLAYLTILFFDERFNFVSAQDGGAYQAQVASNVLGSSLPTLPLNGIRAPKNGYVYVYVSNQSDQDVYFDNLAVTISQGNIIEENHYYSFGLKIAAISSKKNTDSYDGDIKNNYQMQGAFSEMDDDIGWNDFALRNYDPQIGRWVQIDPYANRYLVSPYVGMGNDPINIIDPRGGETLPYINIFSTIGRLSGEVLPTVTLTSKVVMASKALNTLQIVLKAASILQKVSQAGEILAKAANAGQVGNRPPGGYYLLNGRIGFNPRIKGPDEVLKYYGRTAVYLGHTSLLYSKGLEAQGLGTGKGKFSGIPMNATTITMAFFKQTMQFSGEIAPYTETEGVPAGITTYYKIGGFYDNDEESETYSTINLRVYARTTGGDDLGEPSYSGTIEVKQDGKTLFTKSLEKDENFEEEGGARDVGITSFKLQRGQTYEIVINLNFVPLGDDGNRFTIGTETTTEIKFTVKK